MLRDEFKDLLWFMEVARERNFTRAAAKLGTSQATLSQRIKKLEERLGVRLLNRTTRSVATTEAGERMYQALWPRFEAIESDLSDILEYREKPAGTVRLTLSEHALTTVVWPKLRPLLQAYPDIQMEFSCDQGLTNIIEKRFDAGVRLGESIDQDMIAVRIGPDWRMVAVASPAYLGRNDPIDHPQDLVAHRCINARQQTSGALAVWEFSRDNKDYRVQVDGQLTFNTGQTMRDAAVNGMGIAYLPEDIVRTDIDAGRLQIILNDWSKPFPGYFLYYPSRKQMTQAMSLVVGALRKERPE